MIVVLCANPAVDTFLRTASLRPGAVNRATEERSFPGGKGVHVALALRELGEDVLLVGFWGGATGQWIRAQCEARGVRCAGPETAEWTRTCLTIHAADQPEETEVLGIGPTLSPALGESLVETWREALRGGPNGFCVSGSLPRGAPPELYSRLIAMARDASVAGFLDCTGEPFRLAVQSQSPPFGLHLNQTEAETFSGRSGCAETARGLAEQVTQAAITAGKDGLYLGAGAAVYHARVEIPKVISAVGSGDCLTAGLVLAKARGLPPAEAARWGVACGAANCLREDLGMLHRSDVERLLPAVNVAEV